MKSAYLQIIRICNQNCLFCAQPQNGLIMNLESILKQFIFYKKQGVKKVIITGGEPTLHKDFLKIVKLGVKFNFYIIIQTNGNQFFDINLINGLKKIKNIEFIISLHSHIPKIHDFVKQSEGSYIKTVNGLFNLNKNLEKNNIKIRISIALNNYNIKDIYKTISFFLDKFGFIDGIILNNLDIYNISKKNYNIIISNLKSFDDNFRKALGLIVENGKTLNIERIPLCYLEGYESYADSLEYILGNDIKYVHYLQDDRKSEFIDKEKRTPKHSYGKKCKFCSLKKYCGGIPELGNIYSESDLIEKDFDNSYIKNILNIYYKNNNET